MTGAANFIGDIAADGSSISITTSRANASLRISSIKASSGNVEVRATGIGSDIVVLPTQADDTNISAFSGDVSLLAGSIYVGVTKDLATVSELSSISISGESTTISTLTNSSGSIRIGGNIESSDSINISVHGSGNIITLSEAQITGGIGAELVLNAEDGNIGSPDARLRIHTSILEITSQSNYGLNRGAFISSVPAGSLQQALIVRATTMGGMLSIRHVGDIYLGRGDGDVETISVGGADIRSVESEGNIVNRAILASEHNINLQAQGIGAIFQGRPEALLQAQQSITLTTQNGQIGEPNFAGATPTALRVSGNKLSFQALESVSIHSIKEVRLGSSSSRLDTRLLVDGNLTKESNAVLSAGGRLLIQTTTQGSIGTNTAPLTINANKLSFLSDRNANIFKLEGDLEVEQGTAKGNVSIVANNNLSLGRIQSSTGSVTATSQFGNVSVVPNGFIDAHGQIKVSAEIPNRVISFAPNTELHSLTGPITVQIGTAQSKSEPTPQNTINNILYQPAGGIIVIPSEESGGQNRILGSSGQNIVRAEHSRINLLPGTQSGQIELNGGVRISIDNTAVQQLPPSPLTPISFSNRAGLPEELQYGQTPSARIWSQANANVYCQKGLLQVHEGESIIFAAVSTRVNAGELEVLLDKQSVVQIFRSDGVVIIRCLLDHHAGAVKIHIGRDYFELHPGQELILGNEISSRSAYRNRKELNSDFGKIIMREFSLLSLYGDGELLSLMSRSEGSMERWLLSKIGKLFICSQIVRVSNEPFTKR